MDDRSLRPSPSAWQAASTQWSALADHPRPLSLLRSLMSLCFRRLVAGLVVVLFALFPSAAGASGGTYTHVLCANPDTGLGVVGSNGKLPDGTTNPFNVQFAGVSTTRTRCA